MIGYRSYGNHLSDRIKRDLLWLFKIPHTDFKMKINKYVLQQRKQRWNNNKNNKLLEIKPTLGEWK